MAGEEFSGFDGVIVGWGQTKFNGSLSIYLKHAKVHILPDSTCIKSPIGSHFAENPNSMVCAYGHKTDACKVSNNMLWSTNNETVAATADKFIAPTFHLDDPVSN